jgi:hypothetical protein
MIDAILAAVLPFAAAAAMPAASSPPVPKSLIDRAGVVCFMITNRGNVADAFVAVSTGDPAADADMVDYARQLKWPEASVGDSGRNRWIPLPITMGKAKRAPVPDSCAPPTAG